MRAAFLLPALIALLAAGPAAAEPDLTRAELLSASAGSVLGAASACREIGPARLAAVTDRMAALVSAVIADPDELASAQELFAVNLGAGKQAVESGRVACGSVEASLSRLESLGSEAD